MAKAIWIFEKFGLGYIAVFWLLVISAGVALSQEAPVSVPFLKAEREFVTERVCRLAEYAAKAEMDGVCDRLRRKFEQAEKDAAKVPEPKKD